jgi:hypothetical protein
MVRTASGATAVQIVHSSRRARDIEHVGSAHDEVELEALKAAAPQRLATGQGVLNLGLDAAAWAGPLEIVSSRMGHLWDALCRPDDRLGFDEATGGDEVFRQLVLARIIESTSKLGSLRVLIEAGIAPASYATLKRRLPAYAETSWREDLVAACAVDGTAVSGISAAPPPRVYAFAVAPGIRDLRDRRCRSRRERGLSWDRAASSARSSG